MPKRPVSGAKMVSLELPTDLVNEMKEFAKNRGQGFKDAVAEAMRRHLTYPPPPPVPVPPPTPFPDVVGVDVKPTTEPEPKKPATKKGGKK